MNSESLGVGGASPLLHKVPFSASTVRSLFKSSLYPPCSHGSLAIPGDSHLPFTCPFFPPSPQLNISSSSSSPHCYTTTTLMTLCPHSLVPLSVHFSASTAKCHPFIPTRATATPRPPHPRGGLSAPTSAPGLSSSPPYPCRSFGGSTTSPSSSALPASAFPSPLPSSWPPTTAEPTPSAGTTSTPWGNQGKK